MKYPKNGFIGIGLVIISIVILLGLGWIFLYMVKDTNSKKANLPVPKSIANSISNGVTINESVGSETLNLYPGVVWHKPVKISKSDKAENYLLFVNGESATLSGNAWRYIKENDTNTNIEDFQKYYLEKLKADGWTNEPITILGLRIEPMLADGPTGSVNGYLKVKDNFVKEIVISYFYLNAEDSPKSTLELEVFESDLINILDLDK